MVDKNTDILLLDGECGLCNRLAIFMNKNLDSGKKIKFQSIDSNHSQELIQLFQRVTKIKILCTFIGIKNLI